MTSLDGGLEITALRANPRNQEGHLTHNCADPSDFIWEGGTDDEAHLTRTVPLFGCKGGDVQIQRLTVARDIQKLQIGASRIGGTAQDNDALALVFEVGLNRIASHVGVHGNGIGAIAPKCFEGVVLRRAANITPLGIQNDWNMRIAVFEVLDEFFQLILSPLGGEVGKLGFKGTHHIGGGIGNIAAELKNAQGFAARGSGHAFGVGVKANAQHAALRSPCRLELLVKGVLA
jgi:hypothetical protein